MYFVKITDQGQISIPAEIRRSITDKNLVVEYSEELNQIIATPVPSILNFAGKYKNRALKNKTIDEIIQIENQAIIEGNIESHWKNK